MAESGTLTRRQKNFISALLGARSVRDAALATGIPERTCWRWLAISHVKAALTAQQDAALEDVTRQVVSRMAEALNVLAGIMQDVSMPPSSRVAAARCILESGLRFSELITLAERVAQLEQKLGGEYAS